MSETLDFEPDFSLRTLNPQHAMSPKSGRQLFGVFLPGMREVQEALQRLVFKHFSQAHWEKRILR